MDSELALRGGGSISLQVVCIGFVNLPSGGTRILWSDKMDTVSQNPHIPVSDTDQQECRYSALSRQIS